MPSVFIYNKSNQKEETFKKDFYWYDPVEKKGKTFECSRLEYKNVYSEEIQGYRLIPIPKNDIKTTSREVDEGSAENWLNTYLNYNDVDISVIEKKPEGILINIENKDLDDALDNIKRQGLKSRVT